MTGCKTLAILVGITIKHHIFILISQKVKELFCAVLYIHLRYYLEGGRPSQTYNLLYANIKIYY